MHVASPRRKCRLPMLSMQTGYRRPGLDAPRAWNACLSNVGAIPDGLPMQHDIPPRQTLAQALDLCRTQPGAWVPAYDALIARLRASGATDGAPRPGDILPDFALADTEGTLRRLSDLANDGPVVLSFNRGSWCPFCEAEIAAWSARLEDLSQVGARLVLVTPETGGLMRALAAIAGNRATVLCDADLGVALRLGLAFPVGPLVLRGLIDDGLDLSVVNGTSGGFLPVPATFVIDRNRIVRFAHVDPDFSKRAEPSEAISALAAIQGRS